MSLPQFRSSGDLTADRRYEYAVALLKEGDAQAAADLIEQALELAPDWVVGWFALGTARIDAGNGTGAIAALSRALALDPEDSLGARLHLARLGAARTPQATAIAYVRDLFDDYAVRFDDALVTGLRYRAPQLIAADIDALYPGRSFERCLDLGCGTGLMAAELRTIVRSIDGVDLSAGMIAEARSKTLYDDLEVGEILEVMQRRPDALYDLITAADIFCYLGDLMPVFREAQRLLRPGGLFAFSVERLAETSGSADFELADSLRFRHTHAYLARTADTSGFSLHACREAVLRYDRGQPIDGLIVTARKPESSAE